MEHYFGHEAVVNISKTCGDGGVMHVLRQSGKELVVSLHHDEVRLIINALNEVCNGLDIQEFSVRLGAELAEAKPLLNGFLVVADSDAGD